MECFSLNHLGSAVGSQERRMALSFRSRARRTGRHLLPHFCMLSLNPSSDAGGDLSSIASACQDLTDLSRLFFDVQSGFQCWMPPRTTEGISFMSSENPKTRNCRFPTNSSDTFPSAASLVAEICSGLRL